MKTNILDIQFDNLTREEARQAGAELLRSSDFHYAVTPNPEFILTADKDLEFQKILNQADLVLPDGIGVVYSAKILGTPLKERVAGFDFACDMLDVLDEMGGRLYLLGSKPGVAEEAGRRILEQHPNIVLCGVHDGYFQDSDPVAHEVAQAQPDLLFVCLGAPKQEQWQKLGMEWAYRLVKEPKRIGRMAKLPLVLVKAAGRRASGRGKQRVL